MVHPYFSLSWEIKLSSSRAQSIHSRPGTVEEERTPNGFLVTANTTSGTSFTASCSTSTQESRHELSPPNHDVEGTEARPELASGSRAPDLEKDEPCNSQPHVVSTQHALIKTTPTSSPPQKPALIPQAPISTSLPTPTSKQTLYHNLLLSLSLKPLPRFPALIDYHDSYPKFRSTQSYNLLIELSIRHAQFGVTRWLLDAMIQDKIPRDSTTHKLSIRWLVRTGNWEQAWTQVSGLTPDEALDKPLRNGLSPITTQVPWYLWLELLSTTKRGALRYTRDVRWSIDEDGKSVRLPRLDITGDPAPGTKAYLRRQRLLACLHPVLESGAKGRKARPSLIKGAVYAILRDGRASAAAELVKTFFSMLPAKISDETAAQCLDIIHLLLSADTKNGLASMYANRRLLVSLLEMHPSFKPSSTTLYLILSPLKKAKKCGTVAFNVMKAFRKSWGAGVVDSRVRRRVGTLALKEGRMDIAQAMLDETKSVRKVDPLRPSVAVASPAVQTSSNSRGLRRPPDRELFSHEGTEKVLWAKFRSRVRWKQRADKGDKLIKIE